MRLTTLVATATTAAILAGTVVWAGSHNTPEAMAIKARQSHMQLYQFNAGLLFGIAKGDVEFDAERAQTAADNLNAVANLSQAGYWLPGTTTDDVENTRALAAAWAPDSKVGDLLGDLRQATGTMAENAGTLEGVQANIRAVGEACTACHKLYRQPE